MPATLSFGSVGPLVKQLQGDLNQLASQLPKLVADGLEFLFADLGQHWDQFDGFVQIGRDLARFFRLLATRPGEIINALFDRGRLNGCTNMARVVTTGANIDTSPGADPKVTSDSAAVGDKATANQLVKEDYYGNMRPQGGGYDIGFQEVR